MSKFELTKKAKEDLKGIAKYTENRWGRNQRNKYIKQLDNGFYFLAESPKSGMECDEIKEGYRKFPQGSHLIFYKKVTAVKVKIIRILHKNMDVESKF